MTGPIDPQLHEFLVLDAAPILTATLAALTCALVGNFLILRKLSMMGDAISHAVLPGLVGGFLVLQSTGTWPMFVGALAAAVATVVLVEAVRIFGKVEHGASMGVVFALMFAVGVIMLEQSGARDLHVDPDCVLYGALEGVAWWDAPTDWNALLTPDALATLPRQLPTSAAVLLIVAAFVAVFFKELRFSAFDPGLASSLGFSPTLLHFLLMILTAAAVVASFEAVGSILVIAMLICPAAAARLLTDRLPTQIAVSLALAAAGAVGGYLLAAFPPPFLGLPEAVNAAGMIAAVSGVLLTLAILFAPRHGVVPRQTRRIALAVRVAREDLLAALLRLEESWSARLGTVYLPVPSARRVIGGGATARFAIAAALRGGDVAKSQHALRLTDEGRRRATRVIRSHRLWETYLVKELGLRPDHVHHAAERLEHLHDPRAGAAIVPANADVREDPHGRPIPAET